MSELKFSVSMCVYEKDDPAWFQTSVDSILNQTKAPDEVVLVVDGPVPEELGGLIEEYKKLDFFRVIPLEKNMGHGEARRICLSHCSYDLVALMDADDISTPDRFEKQLRAFSEDEDLAIVGGNITEFIGEPENVVAKRIVPETDKEIKEYMKKRCPMNQVTVMFRKNMVEAVGGYIDWYCEEDYYLWLRMALKEMRFQNLKDTLVNVRIGKDMYHRRGGVKYFSSEARLQKYMLDHKVIGIKTYLVNVIQRLILQVLLPNKLRGWVFQNLARKKA